MGVYSALNNLIPFVLPPNTCEYSLTHYENISVEKESSTMLVHIFKKNPPVYNYKGRFTVRLMML